MNQAKPPPHFPNEFASSTNSNIFEACKTGDIDKVREMFNKGESITLARKGYTPMWEAYNHNHMDLVQVFIELGAPVAEGLVIVACEDGNVAMLEKLLQAGGYISYYNYNMACYYKNWEVWEVLVRHDLERKALVDMGIRKRYEANGWTWSVNSFDDHFERSAYLAAIQNGFIRALDHLYQSGFTMKAHQTLYGVAPLSVSVHTHRDVKTTLWLLEHGFDPNVRGRTALPLYLAISDRDSELAIMLMKHGARCPEYVFQSLRYVMDWKEACLVARLMVKSNPTLDLKALMQLAVELNFAELVWTLISCGATVERESEVWKIKKNTATLEALQQRWTPQHHHLVPKPVRDAIVCTLLVAKGQKWDIGNFVLLHIFSFLAYGWPYT